MLLKSFRQVSSSFKKYFKNASEIFIIMQLQLRQPQNYSLQRPIRFILRTEVESNSWQTIQWNL